MKISPLLQEKYKRQEEEYEQTKHMTTSEYIRWKEKMSEEIIHQMGYTRKMVRRGVYKLVKQ